MKFKRYFNQILKPYKTIIKEIFGDYRDVEVTIGKSFCCFCHDTDDLSIEIPIIEDTMGKKAFYEKMQKRLKEFDIKEQYSSEILSFLHEIGHIYTYNKINAMLYIIGTRFISKIQNTKIVYNNAKLTQMCYNFYFNQKLEKNADKWAMLYIKNNQEQVKQWEVMLTKNYKKTMPKLLEKINLKTA